MRWEGLDGFAVATPKNEKPKGKEEDDDEM